MKTRQLLTLLLTALCVVWSPALSARPAAAISGTARVNDSQAMQSAVATLTIGGAAREYESFDEAWQAAIAAPQAEIRLCANIDEEVSPLEMKGGNVKLDLASYTLRTDKSLKLSADARLEVVASEGGGIKSSANNCFDVSGSDAVLTISGGTFSGSTRSIRQSGASSMVTISGGTFDGSASYNSLSQSNGQCVIKGGTFLKAVYSGATIVIEGGTFKPEDTTKKNQFTGTATINGGTFYGIFINGGTTTINYCISANSASGYGLELNSYSHLTVNGGEFKGSQYGLYVPSTKSSVSICGGYFEGNSGAVCLTAAGSVLANGLSFYAFDDTTEACATERTDGQPITQPAGLASTDNGVATRLIVDNSDITNNVGLIWCNDADETDDGAALAIRSMAVAMHRASHADIACIKLSSDANTSPVINFADGYLRFYAEGHKLYVKHTIVVHSGEMQYFGNNDNVNRNEGGIDSDEGILILKGGTVSLSSGLYYAHHRGDYTPPGFYGVNILKGSLYVSNYATIKSPYGVGVSCLAPDAHVGLQECSIYGGSGAFVSHEPYLPANHYCWATHNNDDETMIVPRYDSQLLADDEGHAYNTIYIGRGMRVEVNGEAQTVRTFAQAFSLAKDLSESDVVHIVPNADMQTDFYSTLDTDCRVYLDLDGHTLISKHYISIVKGSLIVQGNGCILGKNTNYVFENKDRLTLGNGTYDASNGTIVNSTGGTLNIVSGTFNGGFRIGGGLCNVFRGTFSDNYTIFDVASNGNLVINNGTFSNNDGSSHLIAINRYDTAGGAKVEIRNGNFYGSVYNSKGTLTIRNGYFTNQSSAVYNSDGTCTILGGIFEGGKGDYPSTVISNTDGELYIKGGEFFAGNYSTISGNNSRGHTHISGGRFLTLNGVYGVLSNSILEMLDEGYHLYDYATDGVLTEGHMYGVVLPDGTLSRCAYVAQQPAGVTISRVTRRIADLQAGKALPFDVEAVSHGVLGL